MGFFLNKFGFPAIQLDLGNAGLLGGKQMIVVFCTVWVFSGADVLRDTKVLFADLIAVCQGVMPSSFQSKRLPTETIDGKRKLDHRYYTKNPGNDMRLYIGGLTNHFAVFTGNAVADKLCADCTEEILLPLEQDMHREERTPDVQKPTGKFSALYNHGDISGYNSHSEADAALCTMLAMRVGERA